jgi:hypothetical protein
MNLNMKYTLIYSEKRRSFESWWDEWFHIVKNIEIYKGSFIDPLMNNATHEKCASNQVHNRTIIICDFVKMIFGSNRPNRRFNWEVSWASNWSSHRFRSGFSDSCHSTDRKTKNEWLMSMSAIPMVGKTMFLLIHRWLMRFDSFM